jgi:hypothetical protein
VTAGEIEAQYQDLIMLDKAGLIRTAGMRSCSVSGRMMATWLPTESICAKEDKPRRTYYIGLNEFGNVERVYYDKPASRKHYELVEVLEQQPVYPEVDEIKNTQAHLAHDRKDHEADDSVRSSQPKKRRKQAHC